MLVLIFDFYFYVISCLGSQLIVELFRRTKKKRSNDNDNANANDNKPFVMLDLNCLTIDKKKKNFF